MAVLSVLLAQQVRIDAGLEQLPFQGRQGPLGVVQVGEGLMFVFLALGERLEVVGLGRRQVLFRIGAGLDQFFQPVATSFLAFNVSTDSLRMFTSCFSLKGTSARALSQSA